MPSRKLAAYRAKRDFNRTGEPSGAEKVTAGRHLRFVRICRVVFGYCSTQPATSADLEREADQERLVRAFPVGRWMPSPDKTQ